jgi:hypothetical protein
MQKTHQISLVRGQGLGAGGWGSGLEREKKKHLLPARGHCPPTPVKSGSEMPHLYPL